MNFPPPVAPQEIETTSGAAFSELSNLFFGNWNTSPANKSWKVVMPEMHPARGGEFSKEQFMVALKAAPMPTPGQFLSELKTMEMVEIRLNPDEFKTLSEAIEESESRE